MAGKVTPEMLNTLKLEVSALENNNSKEILIFEKNLQDLQGLPLIDDPDWLSSLESIEIITMEKLPALSSSIRKLNF